MICCIFDIIDILLTILDKLRTACNEIDKSDITVTLDSMSNSQDCFGINLCDAKLHPNHDKVNQ